MNDTTGDQRRFGYRGYIGSRRYGAERAAQHVQNLVIRDYCQRNALPFLLSATEYAMEGCYMVLEDVMAEAEQKLEGVVFYSLFMLPTRPERRHQVYRRLLGAGASLHFGLENLAIRGEADIRRAEDILLIAQATG